MRAFKQVTMLVKTINRGIFIEPVFGGNALGAQAPQFMNWRYNGNLIMPSCLDGPSLTNQW